MSWESGFLIEKGNGFLEMVCSQNTGRIEILNGFVEKVADQMIKLELESPSILNDDRMVRSRRVNTFSESKIQYEPE